MKWTRIQLLITMLLLSYVAKAQENYDLSTFLMKSTFKLEGQQSMGTCFIIGQPLRNYLKRLSLDDNHL